jgi:hypothetical protein
MLLYNTTHLYGQNTNTKDVRSIIRRILATTHDSTIPHCADDLILAVNQQLEEGNIHSPSRYPEKGQHGRVRFRMEKAYQTLESIDAQMNPDLRLVLAWTYFNQLLNALACEAVVQNNGDGK